MVVTARGPRIGSDGLTSFRKKNQKSESKNKDEAKAMKLFKQELEKFNQEAQNAALIERPRLQWKSKLKIASDCAGHGSDLVALKLFGCQHLVTSSTWSANDSTKRNDSTSTLKHRLVKKMSPMTENMEKKRKKHRFINET